MVYSCSLTSYLLVPVICLLLYTEDLNVFWGTDFLRHGDSIWWGAAASRPRRAVAPLPWKSTHPHACPRFGRFKTRPHWGGIGQVLVRTSNAPMPDEEHSLLFHANTDGFLWVWQPCLTLCWSRAGECTDCHSPVSAGQQPTAERQLKKWTVSILHLEQLEFPCSSSFIIQIERNNTKDQTCSGEHTLENRKHQEQRLRVERGNWMLGSSTSADLQCHRMME